MVKTKHRKPYQYNAINTKGRSVSGTISAFDEVELSNKLSKFNLELVKAKDITTKRRSSSKNSLKKLPAKTTIQFFIMLNRLQKAGFPLIDSLEKIIISSRDSALRDMLITIQQDVSEGSSLSEAIWRFPRVFNEYTVAIIKAHENTGDLVAAYETVVDNIKKSEEVKRKIKNALAYPCILIVVLIAVIVVMMTFTIPPIIGFFENQRMDLPFATIALIESSHFVQSKWMFIILATASPYLIYQAGIRMFSEFKYAADRLILALPVFGEIVLKAQMLRFLRTFSVLHSAQISILDSIRIAKNTVTNEAMNRAVDDAHSNINAGHRISDSFTAAGFFPPLMIDMIAMGEEAGEFELLLGQTSDFYEDDIDDFTKTMTTLIEPVITAILGAFILWIMIAVFGPIYSSFENLDI